LGGIRLPRLILLTSGVPAVGPNVLRLSAHSAVRFLLCRKSALAVGDQLRVTGVLHVKQKRLEAQRWIFRFTGIIFRHGIRLERARSASRGPSALNVLNG